MACTSYKPPVNRQPLIVNRQPSVINRQSSTVSRQPSVLNRQSSTVSHRPSVVSRPPSIVNRQSSTISRRPSGVNRQPSVVNRQSSTVDRQTSSVSPCRGSHKYKAQIIASCRECSLHIKRRRNQHKASPQASWKKFNKTSQSCFSPRETIFVDKSCPDPWCS